MDASTPDVRIQEALATVGQYFSDTIPPVQATESLAMLLTQPAQLMASEIIQWISTQYHGKKLKASVVDYLFHTICKLNYFVHLQLISKELLTPYLDSVKQLLLDYCPPEDRQLLMENFCRIDISETEMSAPISLIYHRLRPGESKSEIREGPLSEEIRDRRLSILWDRLKSEARQPVVPAGKESRQELVPQLIATAASNAQSGEEFRKFQENLKSLGIDSGADQMLRTLSRSLPGWMVPATGPDSAKSHNPAVEAMSQIIHLAENKWESSKRFQDMVHAAIEQFNTGSLARAATMFDLALRLVAEGKLDPAAVTHIRKTGHESLDMNHLRDLIRERGRHHLLRKVLNFFDEFSVKNLLDSLQQESRRERRRMLLSLLDVHSEAARKTAFERLKEILADADIINEWHFIRNLVYILNETPRTGDAPLDVEMGLVARLLNLSLPPPLVKEAIRYAGQIKCTESERLLISTAGELEKTVFEGAISGKDTSQKLSLLDRALFALAHYGTPKAYGVVVEHGTSRYEEMGDTASRLTYLAGQDLTSDEESINRLIRFLKSKMPRKLLGMTIQKNDQLLLHAIKALSSTPAPLVRQTFADIAAQFHEAKFGQAAAKALKEFEAMDKAGIQADRVLNGELDLFGLPDLLQKLSRQQETGTLTLKDAKGNPAGTFSLRAGRMQDCSAGRLSGKEAVYQLLEKPTAGTYVFQGQKNSGIQTQTEKAKLPDFDSIISEGLRRYDDLQRARAIVPDSTRLKRKGPEPVRRSEEDEDLFDPIWQKTANGTTPEECEAICKADSCRVRILLARWIEEGVLTVE